MFKVDDIVVYGINGVCKIVEIEEKDLMGSKKKYLVLKPLNGDASTYFIPTDNKKLLEKIHKVLSEDEINQLIDSMPNEKEIWIDSEKQRKELYKKIIADGQRLELIRMIKAIYLERKEREKKGKCLHISDERFLKDAEKLLYSEFQYVLKLSENELMSYIFTRIEQSNAQ